MNNILNTRHNFDLSVGSVLKGAWKACFDNIGISIIVSVGLLVFFAASNSLLLLAQNKDIGGDISDIWSSLEVELTPLFIVASVIVLLLQAVISPFVYNFALAAVSKGKVSTSAFFLSLEKFKKVFVTHLIWLAPLVIITSLPISESATGLLYIPLIVIVMYFLIKYAFAEFVILDKNTSVVDGFKQSGEITANVKPQIVLITVVVFVCATAFSIITLGLGLLVAFALIEFAYAYTYKALRQRKK